MTVDCKAAAGQVGALAILALVLAVWGWSGNIRGQAMRDRPLEHDRIWIEFVDAQRQRQIMAFSTRPSLNDILHAVGLGVDDQDGERLLADGAKIVLESHSGAVSTGSMSEGTALALGRKMDLNRAFSADLILLPGIGPVTATRLIDDRRRNGPYRSASDVQRVAGIGPRTFDRIAPRVMVRAQSSFFAQPY